MIQNFFTFNTQVKNGESAPKSIYAVFLGHVVERYEVFLFACYSAVLAPIFFSDHTNFVATLASFGTLASGYVMRPLGGILFGYIGDRYGRRTALIWSIVPVSAICFLIGCLPTYAEIGLAAPILLVSLRLIQGVFVGGEYSGAIIYFFESTIPSKKGFVCGVICALGFLGALLATATSAFTSLYPHILGWRAGFFAGGVLGIIVFFLRMNVLESADFSMHQKRHKQQQSYFSFRFSKELVLTFFFGAMNHIPLYISTVFLNFLLLEAGLTHVEALAISTGILGLWFVTLLAAGYLSDYVGQAYLIRVALTLLCFSTFPLFAWIDSGLNPVFSVVVTQVVLTLLGAMYLAPTASFIPSLFDIRSRYRHVALGITVGKALGGSSPFICLYFYKQFEATQYISLYISLVSLVTLMMVIRCLKKEVIRA